MCKDIIFMCIVTSARRGFVGASVELENFLFHRITPHWRKRLPMQRRRTILHQSCQMLRRAVALVRSQTILGKHGIPLAHHSVAFDFGKNRSRRNRSRKRIPVDDGFLRQIAIQPQRIDQKMIRRRRSRITASRMASRDA